MLKLGKLTLKNFMSFGNIEHAIDLDDNNLILVIGENRDVTTNGSFSDSKNGTGKSTVINAISYVFYDKPLGRVKKDNLVNKYNEKNMVVSLTFTKNSDKYKIIRGRKPNFLKFYVNEKEFVENQAQGNNRDTQGEIEHVIGITYDVFKQIITLSAQTDAFLSLRDNDQRIIIEELLGITQLSEKAEKLKSMVRNIQKDIDQETFQIQTLQNLNEKTLSQIKRLQNLSDKWDKDHQILITDLEKSIQSLTVLDIQKELDLHVISKKIADLSSVYKNLSNEEKNIDLSIKKTDRSISTISDNLQTAIIEKKCYACGQSIDENHQELLDDLKSELKTLKETLDGLKDRKEKLISDKKIIETEIVSLGEVEEPFYKSEKDAWDHNGTIENLKKNLEREQTNKNPYSEQISNLKKENLSKIDIDKLDNLKSEKVHQEFLLKILTNKDSFVRKKIIDQSLTFLNFRLDHYLTEIGLPHTVKFQNDLSVKIDLLGREYDFDNLSRGQKTRLIISLNFAFRDVFESLNFPINMIFVDELLDNGLDPAGIDNSVRILKEMARTTKKSIFLVSHKEEIKPRVDKTITVILENGFSSIGEDD